MYFLTLSTNLFILPVSHFPCRLLLNAISFVGQCRTEFGQSLLAQLLQIGQLRFDCFGIGEGAGKEQLIVQTFDAFTDGPKQGFQLVPGGRTWLTIQIEPSGAEFQQMEGLNKQVKFTTLK
jgi:hypothetical protein